MPDDFTDLIPDQEILEKRFAFIDDPVLRSNTVITFRYIVFLINLEQSQNLPGPIVYSLHKDIVIQTATIIESCIHHLLARYMAAGEITEDNVLTGEWKEDRCEILHEFKNRDQQVTQICGIVRHQASEKFTKHTPFIALNRACLRAKLFSQIIFDQSEYLRESRNKIHLAGLDKIDEVYKKKEVDKHLEYARKILNRIEHLLKKV